MIGNDWDEVLKDVFNTNEFINMYNNVLRQYKENTCYPEFDNIFNAFKLTSYKSTKVVIIGQDPYHGEGEAQGLAFSVPIGKKIPPSLNNIFKELYSDIHISNTCGDLTSWAEQGVLLLNSVLTVVEDKAFSHCKIGWEMFSDEVIRIIDKKEEPVVFVLWGKEALKKKCLIQNKKHLIIESSHPSPFSARISFFGSKPFSKINDFLSFHNISTINFKN
ncbi:MAG: uracil-DNA glycosylase [Bacilli bacterium]